MLLKIGSINLTAIICIEKMHWKLGQENYGVILLIRKVSLNAVKRQFSFHMKNIFKKCDSHLHYLHSVYGYRSFFLVWEKPT